jgi:predicted nucleic-acid-binding protein
VIGLDSNIILRLFGLGDRAQTKAAEDLIATEGEAGGCLVNPIVLAEIVWTFDRSTMTFDRDTGKGRHFTLINV